MIYIDAVAGEEETFWTRPSGLIWQQDSVLTGRTTDEIGARAFAAGVELHELRSHTSGLEEIYFQLTAGQGQFSAPSPGSTDPEGALR